MTPQRAIKPICGNSSAKPAPSVEINLSPSATGVSGIKFETVWKKLGMIYSGIKTPDKNIIGNATNCDAMVDWFSFFAMPAISMPKPLNINTASKLNGIKTSH